MFGQLPIEGMEKSPFLDERVRQAFSMAINRSLWIDVIYAVPDFSDAGIDVETRWNTALMSDVYEGWWLDPQGSDFGENAKYYEFNLEEATKLMDAAGFSDGLDFESYIANRGFGTEPPRLIEILEGFVKEAGFRTNPNLIDYATEYVPNIRDAEGQFAGLGYKSGPAPPASTAIARLIYDYHSESDKSRYGYDVNGVGDNSGDPHVDELLNKAKAEFDKDARMALVHELQRYLAKTQYAVRLPGGANHFSLAWPAVRNYGTWRSDQPTRLANKTWWLDQTQPPLA
jgi:ABC-type transport system substrate-binding protein